MKGYYFLVVLLLTALCGGGYVMYQQQYKMAVHVTPESENDPEWPSKKKWFDASEWLSTPQYIKINDFYVINTRYVPIGDLNSDQIIFYLKKGINGSEKRFSELSVLSDLDNQEFRELMKDKLSSEYLETQFDKETLTPTIDFFLIYFIYNNKRYEVPIRREYSVNKYHYWVLEGSVKKAGYWHERFPASYSYRKYLNK
ncbi:TPA: hypothetical protein MIU62_01110 [Klebsiella pneumoniae]|nr:hypothetical protein [Klebsiella pneumoniae]